MRGYWQTALMAATELGDSPLFLMDYALRLLRVVVLVALWRSILAAGQSGSPMSLGAVLTYTVAAEAFAQQLTVRTTLANAFWEGTIVMRFLQPAGVLRQFGAETAGRSAVHFLLFSIPLLLVAPLLGVDPRPASPAAGALFPVSLALAIAVGLAVDFIFGALTAALEQPVWLVDWVRTALVTLLAGSLLPLALYPWGLGQLFAWLPFAAMAWVPLAIYTGAGAPVPLLLAQVSWACALWPLCLWLWRANREKLVAYGG